MENKTAKRILWEIEDLLTGAAFPLMLQLIFSASILIFADTDDTAIKILCIAVGEILLVGAYIIFGRQNGISAYRRTVQGAKKRELDPFDGKAKYHIGEYAIWKGFVIGAISCIPFMIFQLIECIFHNDVCTFALKYAFGWAYYPFTALSLSPWLNFIWILLPVGVHAAAYVFGASKEIKRRQKVNEAQEMKGKRKK